ncbi:mitochondrial import inner membrane translocase subunit TIM44 isoform X2 [Camponotus floridanus]|uniref:mitochondrial import inner membrane translocase subunit TIM44 isoform X2 n=1 Tax=Camponotus floridanus TaxID=104421 RepID=UPI00059CAB9D|nr:mitochondrial import inner membrane translocase subunit TIM44 isoform X2 [Camponotus floridanus]
MNIASCRASLRGATRSVQSTRNLRNGSRERLSLRTLPPTSVEMLNVQMQLIRLYSSPARRPSFLSQFIENIKQEMQKNKEMKESLKKFREEAEKLEQSEALRTARQKFHAVESEASKGSEAIKEKLDTLKEKVQEVIEEASKTELGKRAGQLGEEITKSAKGAAETISEKSQALGKTGAFQTISHTAEAVRNELDQHGILGKVYVPPKKLRKRKEVSIEPREIMPDQKTTGVEIHKDFMFSNAWQKFKENNPYVNKVMDWKMKYDESDNAIFRASKLLTDKVSDIMGGLFQKTELSETLTEICKLDPNFSKIQFLKDCETDFIPNILEAMIRGDLEILKDWCHEGPYNLIAQPHKEVKKLGHYSDSKILDIDNVDLMMGKMMEQGPVLIISFQSQQIMCVRNSKNEVIEGDPQKVMRVNYVWVMCRDRTELNSKAAWRLLDLSATSSEQLV